MPRFGGEEAEGGVDVLRVLVGVVDVAGEVVWEGGDGQGAVWGGEVGGGGPRGEAVDGAVGTDGAGGEGEGGGGEGCRDVSVEESGEDEQWEG